MNRAVFLDRDGVINRKVPEGQYVTSWNDMTFLPGVADAILLLKRAGFKVIIVSNQRCVAKGLITADAMDAMHEQMCDALARDGAVIDGIYYCPHDKNAACTCRKPAPGMLLQATSDHSLDLRVSWMIGDSEMDVEAGRNAGCRTVRILPINPILNSSADLFARSLIEAAHRILQLEKPGPDPAFTDNPKTGSVCA